MDELREQRDALLAQAEAIIDAAVAEKRGLSDEEKSEHDRITGEAKNLRALMTQRANLAAERAEILPELRAAAQPDTKRDEKPAAGSTKVTQNDPVYGPHRSNRSFFMDIVRAETKGDLEARSRLAEMEAYNAQELKKRDLYDNATDGAEALVPLYMQDRFEKYRADIAVTSGLTTQAPLPAQGESISIPYQTGAAAVAQLTQATPLTAIQETDAQFDRATANVVEVAGVQDMSLFIQERGSLGVGLDVVIGNHLAELLAQDEDERVLAALDAANGVEVTYTATTGTLSGIYTKLADVAQQIITGNKVPPSAIVIHPRRFFSWASELDDQNRPLMVPMSVGQNPLATTSGDGSPVAHGFSGYAVHGIPIYFDQNITILNGNPGTNQDIVYCSDFSKQYTWLGPVAVELDRSLMFKNSGLTVRARRYFATMTAHRADAFGRITGTGLATPSF